MDWAAYFADDSLSALLSEALSANFDVQAALQRVEAARAGVLAATGVRLPRLDLAAGAGVRKFGLFTMDGAGNASTDIQPGRVVPEDYPDLSLGVSASWEPDLWGRLANLRDSARAQYLATIEGTHLVVSAVVADVAAAYFGLVAADRSLAILQRSLARQEEALEVMRVQKQAARATELAVQQFEAEVASTRALVAQAELTRVELENQLNLLLGRPPQPAPRSDAALSGTFGVELTTGAPSELLRNRPDVREAELRLQSSRFDLEAARAPRSTPAQPSLLGRAIRPSTGGCCSARPSLSCTRSPEDCCCRCSTAPSSKPASSRPQRSKCKRRSSTSRSCCGRSWRSRARSRRLNARRK